MGTYMVLNDRETFCDLDRCLILLPTEEQERRYKEDLSSGEIRPLVNDPDVERIEFSTDFLRRVLRSSRSRPSSGS